VINIVCQSIQNEGPVNPNLALTVLRAEGQLAERRAQQLGPQRTALRERAAAPSPAAVTVRVAVPSDARAIARISDLDSSVQPPRPPLLVGERGGAIAAALSLRDGHVVANPFVPTADLVALLRLRARQLRRERREPSGWRGRASAALGLKRAEAR
jgi:hypothetical protein